MAKNPRRLILGNGESYIKAATKPPTGRRKEPPRSYGEARDRVKADITEAVEQFEALPKEKRVAEEAVFCMRLHPDVTAKTYDPAALFTRAPQLRSVGSRNYKVSTTEVASTPRVEKKSAGNAETLEGRLVFVQASSQGFQDFLVQLDRSESTLTQQFTDEIRRIERFNTLASEEQLVGFGDDWQEGRAELILHPSRTTDERQQEFLFELFDLSGIDVERSSIRFYPSGPTFVSCRIDKESLRLIAGANPLRSAHPLRFRGLTNLRSATRSDSPKPPTTTTRSTIKVGFFDGGIDPTAPLLDGHAEQDDSLSIGTPPNQEDIEHGTAVAGAILHGPLNGIRKTASLAAPPVYAVSFRVFPTSDPTDFDLYECIDVVEKAVPARRDIDVFNLSFGPTGPIEDDPVSRFTYVLDSLAVTHKVSFCVAVGNDGDLAGQERIQAPSDIVHGLGVGASTLDGSRQIHADYSCQGPGRECGKIKPDLLAFGGCEALPMHLVSTSPGKRVHECGTSFSTPVVSRLHAQANAAFDRSSSLLGRGLVVHTAEHPNRQPCSRLGHGFAKETINDILYCDEHSVSVVYQSAILPKQIVQLPIPWPGASSSYNVKITWTIAALTPVDPMHPGDYTSCCLEETFYPDSQKFTFRPPPGTTGKPKNLHMKSQASEVQTLLNAGWKQATWPNTKSGNKYLDENERRAIDCKWESIVRREVSMYSTGLNNPLMTLHAIGRNGAKDRFDYVAIATIKAPKFAGDLYTEIRKQYPALAPVRVRTEAETRVQIT